MTESYGQVSPQFASQPALDVSTGMKPSTKAWLLALVGWTMLLCFYGLGDGARFEPIDCWVAQTAREMRQADDWLVPRYSGETRMQKSPGPYWTVMLVSLARGTPVDEISARIPNALAGVLLTLTIFWLTWRIAGDRAAIFAGFAISSSVFLFWWSHRGASDLGLTALTTASLATLWVGAEQEPPGRRRNLLFLAGYFLAGLGMLWKMPMPLVVVGLPVFLYVLVRNRWRVFASPVHLLGLALFLLPWLPWAIAVSAIQEGALFRWKVEFLDRYTGAMPNYVGEGFRDTLWYYLPMPLVYCLPYTLSLPGAIWRGFRKEPGIDRRGTWFMLIWFFSLLIFFTSSQGKEFRYLLPALPPLFVLLGIELARFFDPHRRVLPRWEWAATIAVWVLLPAALVAGAAYGVRKWWQLRGVEELAGQYAFGDVLSAYTITAAIVVVGIGLAAWLYRRRQEYASFGLLVATMYCTWAYAWPNVTPYFMSQRPYIEFAQKLERRVPPDMRPALAWVGTQDSRVVWYSDLRVPRAIDALALIAEQGGTRDLEYEKRRYAEEVLRRLEQKKPVLFVSPLLGLKEFADFAPQLLAKAAGEMPAVYLWAQSDYGSLPDQFVVFGNRPPPYREPKLRLPDKKWARKLRETVPLGADRPATRPAAPVARSGVE